MMWEQMKQSWVFTAVDLLSQPAPRHPLVSYKCISEPAKISCNWLKSTKSSSWPTDSGAGKKKLLSYAIEVLLRGIIVTMDNEFRAWPKFEKHRFMYFTNYGLWSFDIYFIIEHDSESIPEQSVGEQQIEAFFLSIVIQISKLQSLFLLLFFLVESSSKYFFLPLL